MEKQIPEVVRAHAESIVYIADGFVHSYYGENPDWVRWLADLRAACQRLDKAVDDPNPGDVHPLADRPNRDS